MYYLFLGMWARERGERGESEELGEKWRKPKFNENLENWCEGRHKGVWEREEILRDG